MKVSTFEKPSDSKRRRKKSILTMLWPPTLMARRNAKYLGIEFDTLRKTSNARYHPPPRAIANDERRRVGGQVHAGARLRLIRIRFSFITTNSHLTEIILITCNKITLLGRWFRTIAGERIWRKKTTHHLNPGRGQIDVRRRCEIRRIINIPVR